MTYLIQYKDSNGKWYNFDANDGSTLEFTSLSAAQTVCELVEKTYRFLGVVVKDSNGECHF